MYAGASLRRQTCPLIHKYVTAVYSACRKCFWSCFLWSKWKKSVVFVKVWVSVLKWLTHSPVCHHCAGPVWPDVSWRWISSWWRQSKQAGSYLSWSVWSSGSAWLSSLVHALSSKHVHVHPGTPPLSFPLPLSSSSRSDLLQCGRQLGGWVSRGGEENGKRRGRWRRGGGGGTTLLFFFSFSLHTHPVASTLPVTLFIVVHLSGVDMGGGFWGDLIG